MFDLQRTHKLYHSVAVFINVRSGCGRERKSLLKTFRTCTQARRNWYLSVISTSGLHFRNLIWQLLASVQAFCVSSKLLKHIPSKAIIPAHYAKLFIILIWNVYLHMMMCCLALDEVVHYIFLKSLKQGLKYCRL